MVDPNQSFWWLLKLSIPFELEETLIWKLQDIGIYRFALEYEPEDPSKRLFKVWFDPFVWTDIKRQELIDSINPLAATFGLKILSIIWEKVYDEDWNTSWKKHWGPDPVGDCLLILPAWLNSPAKYSDRIIIKIDPGSAFGTGSHPTTRLCLEALERLPPFGDRVADLGCGSGILTIAALKLGAKKTFALDIDSLAINSTLVNLNLNNINPSKFAVANGSIETLHKLIKKKPVDLLVCNILAPVIKNMAGQFDKVISTKGRALLSGLLVEQADEIKMIFENLGWQTFASYEKNGWGLIEVRRP